MPHIIGAESCLRRAPSLGMNADVNKELIASCETCRKHETNDKKASLMPHEVPSIPWEQIGVDLFELKMQELIYGNCGLLLTATFGRSTT